MFRAMQSARTQDRRRDDLGDALGLLASVWLVLALGGAVAPLVGARAATLASFGLAGGLCAVDAGLRGRRAPRARPTPGSFCVGLGGAAAFAVAGFLVAPAIVLVTALFATSIGLAPPASQRATAGAAALLGSLVLAPAFEEHLYRGRLLPALARRTGPSAAVLVSSALFALPHLTPSNIIGTSLAGLVFGATRLATGRTADCVALHVGMNVAGLSLAGHLPFSTPLPGAGASAAACAALVTGLAIAIRGRERGQSRRPRRPAAAATTMRLARRRVASR